MSESGRKGTVGVVLAGGEGKRLRPLTFYFQKCMIPVGSRQKPLLEYILLTLKKHGIKEVKVLVGYKHEQIENYFNHGERFGVGIEFFVDDPSLLGSGGALLSAARQGAFEGAETLLVYYGDILSSIDLSAMLKQHEESKAAATLALCGDFEVPVGVAEVEGRMVKGWVEKPRIDIYGGIGIVAFSSKVIAVLEKLALTRPKIDIMADLVPALIDNGEPVEAYVTKEFWYDVGSTEKYEKLDNDFVDKLIAF